MTLYSLDLESECTFMIELVFLAQVQKEIIENCKKIILLFYFNDFVLFLTFVNTRNVFQMREGVVFRTVLYGTLVKTRT